MLFNDFIAERNYLASMAGIDFTCKIDESGFVFHYSGFSDVLGLFVQETFDIFLQLPKLIANSSNASSSSSAGGSAKAGGGGGGGGAFNTPYDRTTRFESCKERLEKYYVNFYLKPSKHANRIRRSILKLSNSFQPNSKLAVLSGKDINNNSSNDSRGGLLLDDMINKWMPMITSEGRLQLFVCGNCNKSDALKLAENVKGKLLSAQIKPLCMSRLPKQPILKLCVEKKKLKSSSTDDDDTTVMTPQTVTTKTNDKKDGDCILSRRIIFTICSDDESQNNSACELYWQVELIIPPFFVFSLFFIHLRPLHLMCMLSLQNFYAFSKLFFF
jgi:secreted Zn-dependent insulinase-like peptidase